MNRHCSVQAIRQYVADLEQRGRLSDFDCDTYLGYLKDRYYKNGQETEYFPHLHLDRNHNPAEVLEALSNEKATKIVRVIGCLIVVYRWRNNLFHGEKWLYQLQDQKNNFENANVFLKNLML